MPIKKDKLINIICLLLITFITFSIVSLFSRIGVDAHHDGYMLKPALDLAEGHIPFKETYIQYGLFTTVIQALSLKTFGKYLMSLRLITALFYALIAGLQWLIWKRFLPRYLVITTIIIWLSLASFFHKPFHPWSSVYALFFQLLAGYLLIIFIEHSWITNIWSIDSFSAPLAKRRSKRTIKINSDLFSRLFCLDVNFFHIINIDRILI